MTKEEALNKIKELEEFIKNLDAQVGFEDDEIFLLSKEEYEKYKTVIPEYCGWWWLRSPGFIDNYAASVDYDGSVYYGGHCVGLGNDCVRPALLLSNLESANLKIGERIVKYDFPWIVIDDGLAIAEVPIGMHIFDRGSNDYARSEIRQFLKEWLESRKG